MEVVHGNHSCTEAVRETAPVCNHGNRSRKFPRKPNRVDQDLLTSGICSVGEVGIFINGDDQADEALQYRFCDTTDLFMDAGFLTINAKSDRFEICKTDLCNSAQKITSITVLSIILALFLL